MLSIESLTIEYGRIPAVRDLSLSVDPGEIVSLIGANGAGKTTTIKAIFGLVKPRRGRIIYESSSLVGRTPEEIARRGLALVPEGRHIFQTLSVAENLSLARANGRGGDRELLEDILERFPILRQLYDSPAGGLSGGEQQQLAIARALLSRPEFLALDEPSLGLAPLVVDQVFKVLEDLRARGLTIFLIEQNAARAIELADRTYLLRSGSLVMHGTAEDFGDKASLADAYLGGLTTTS